MHISGCSADDPAFRPRSVNVSLVSLRKKDLRRGPEPRRRHHVERQVHPLTLPALLRLIDAKRIDILHTATARRPSGASRRRGGLPTIPRARA